MTLSVVMVTNNVLEDKIGGHERYVRELSTTLAGLGHEVRIVAKRWSPDAPAIERAEDGVTICRYDVPSKANPLYAALFPAYLARGVAAGARRRKPTEVIHAHMGLSALPLAAQRRPYVFTFHAPVWRELLSERQSSYFLPPIVQDAAVRGVKFVEGLAARRSTKTVVLSEFMRSELARLDRPAADRALVVPGGIDTERFTPDPFRRGDGEPRTSIFTARRLTPRTGVDALIGAMPFIWAEFPDAALDIAGVGPQEIALRELARSVDAAGERIRFLGRISDEALVERYRSATLVALPTRELEGFGLTTAEALACGAAVVGTPAGATPELLAPLDPALLSTDVTAVSLGDTMLRFLRDPERRQSVKDRAHAHVVPSMGWAAVADQYLAIYESLR
jgi:glycosyltransferase involved in cell wall biosynthesis